MDIIVNLEACPPFQQLTDFLLVTIKFEKFGHFITYEVCAMATKIGHKVIHSVWAHDKITLTYNRGLDVTFYKYLFAGS